MSSRASCICKIHTENIWSSIWTIHNEDTESVWTMHTENTDNIWTKYTENTEYMNDTYWEYRECGITLRYYCRISISRTSCICTIHTDEYRGCISIDRYWRIQMLYLDWWILETEGYNWIGTDVKKYWSKTFLQVYCRHWKLEGCC